MTDKQDDEITLKEAAEYVKDGLVDRAEFEKEITEAEAALEAMLGASRAGKTVKGRR